MIELIHLEKKYENATPLKDVNVVINDGDIISIIGPSGTGKSTLIRCINLLDRPTNAKILFDGVDITAPDYDLSEARKRMGMVFQSFNLFGHLTVIENLMLAPVDILKKSKKEAYEKGVELLRRVGLSGREFRYPEQLSGGQKQRVAIARTLAMDPDVILFDEPTSALDPTMVGEVEAVIRDLAGTGKTMLIVTHEMSFARTIANRVFYMDQGGIYEDGTPEQIFDNPQGELTQRFIRQKKALEVSVENRNYDFVGTVSLIDQYCLKNDIPPRCKYKIRLVFEELIQHILVPKECMYPINFLTEYVGKEREAKIIVDYGGNAFDPSQSEDQLAYTLIKNSVDKFTYIHNPEASLVNRVEIVIKE